MSIQDGFVIEKYHRYGIQKLYHLKNNLLITISTQEIRVVDLERLEKYVQTQPKKQSYEQNILHIFATDDMPGQVIVQKKPISSSALHSESGRLVLCLGNGVIVLYHVYKDCLSPGVQIRTGVGMKFISCSEFSEEGRLLAFSVELVDDKENECNQQSL